MSRAATPAPWRAYLLRCRDGSLYAGVSNDLPARLAAHQAGRGARYTRSRRPVLLVWRSKPLGKSPAHRLEWRLKHLPRSDKLLLSGPPGPARRRLTTSLLAGLR
jgi:putative endonuclease